MALNLIKIFYLLSFLLNKPEPPNTAIDPAQGVATDENITISCIWSFSLLFTFLWRIRGGSGALPLPYLELLV